MMVRAFIGVPLPHVLRETAVACQGAFLDADASWRAEKWVAPENLHVTLAFLGEVEERHLEMLEGPLASAARAIEPFRSRVSGIHAIPRQRGATLLWLGVDEGADSFTRLAALCGDIARSADPAPVGPSAPRHRYTPHITLCRARQPKRVTTYAIDRVERLLHGADERARSMSVHSFTLYRSTLTPRGPRYDELATVPLG
jgi:2'-5' RNA ligase